MKRYILALTLLLRIISCYAQPGIRDDSWQLVWHDEFESPIDWTVWQSEHGFVRNHEDQWYQADNAYTKDGILILEAKNDSIINPRYKDGSDHGAMPHPAYHVMKEHIKRLCKYIDE